MILQNIALSKLKTYGVRTGFLGLKRAQVEAQAAALEEEIARSRAPVGGDVPRFTLTEGLTPADENS